MSLRYNLVSTVNEGSSITVFHEGNIYVADQTHPSYDAIVAKALAEDSEVVKLFDVSKTIEEKFNKVSERVSVKAGRVYFDGNEVESSLTKQIVRCMEEDEVDFKPLVNFFEKISLNVNEHSQRQLFDWLEKRNFTIHPDGDIIAYKGVNKDGSGAFVSCSTGKAMVDGKVHEGKIPNYIGAVVEMPRNEVQHDPNVACHTGLHAGNWRYASTFGQGGTLTVKINPRDVVSVPKDSNSEKIRVCRYTVLGVATSDNAAAIYSDPEDEGF